MKKANSGSYLDVQTYGPQLLHSVLNQFFLTGSILSAFYATGEVMKMFMQLPVNIPRPQAPNSRMSVLQLFLQQEGEIK